MNRFVLNSEIMEMLNNFYLISGLRVGVHDLDVKIIIDYPHENKHFELRTFCEKNKAQSNAYKSRCDKCDKAAFEQARITGRPYIYNCHMGFMEAVVPVMAKDEPFCFLMIGQVRSEAEWYASDEELRNNIKEIFKKYGISEDKYDLEQAVADYKKMKRMDSDTFEAYVYFLELCAQKIYNDKYLQREQRVVSKELADYVKANLYNDITIADFAEELCLSRSYLSHLIADEMDTSFIKYLNARRMEEAKKLLRVTDMSVKKIAVLLRYNDVAYFSRTFKKLTGMTCTEYRRFKVNSQKV